MEQQLKSFYFTKKLDEYGKWGYVRVLAPTLLKARERMINVYGIDWGFVYPSLENIHPLDRILIAVI